jgi:hypothetical protein
MSNLWRGRLARELVTYSLLPRAFPEKFQWPGAMSSLTVARQRGIYTRFPILLKQGGRANLF